jgi:hypothetical protein
LSSRGENDSQLPSGRRVVRERRFGYWLISQGRAAEIAGLSRADFLDALYRAKVPACQITVEELKEELELLQ